MPEDLLHEAVADRHAAGDGDMGADGARQFDQPEQAGSTAVDLRDAPHQPHGLCDDENHVQQGARADGRDEADALGRIGDLAAGGVVERRHQRAFGDVDEIAAVDDLARQLLQMGATARHVRPAVVKAGEFDHVTARGVAVVLLARLGQSHVQLRDGALARDGEKLAPAQDEERQPRQPRQRQADGAEHGIAGEQAFDELRQPQRDAEGEERARRRPEQPAPGHQRAADDALLLRDLHRLFACRPGGERGVRLALVGVGDLLDHGGGGARRGGLVERDFAVAVEAEGARAGALGVHARRSPNRNSIARSRRMCGSGRNWPSSAIRASGGRKRRKR